MAAPINRPGLDALAYRAGTYATFMRAMTERLRAGRPAWTAREPDDPSLALLDGWAILADVLTFHQERIANEGYLRTATEKRSLLQLANLVGYKPRPGVAASVFLAYTLHAGADATLAAGSKAQSVPGPGETAPAQTYEISDDLAARDCWNTLPIRMTRPHDPSGNTPFYLTTATLDLKTNDVLLFVRNGTPESHALPDHRFVRIARVEPQPAQNRTKITLQGPGLVWAADNATTPVDVYAFRIHAAPYGHNAPAPPIPPAYAPTEQGAVGPDWPLALADRDPHDLSLDARYDRVAPGSFVGVRTFPKGEPALFTVSDTRERSRRDYGLAASTTVLRLNAGYFDEPAREPSLAPLRDVDVFAHSERLQLADAPIDADIPDDPQATPSTLELDALYDGLAPGRWAIVAGTRTDLPGVAGAEVVMVAATEHRANPAIPGDKLHTFVTLSTKLAYSYARSSVTVWGNVARATHGETRNEIIGSGDAARARQSFALTAKPLTFVAASTRSGIRSTLSVRVNGALWAEAEDLNSLGPTDRAYTLTTTDAGTKVTFGDGVHGARLPTGTENVAATYRTGLGSSANVDQGKISRLTARPPGVKAVGNPLPACGGTDSESRDDIRRNLPTALLAVDRLVSLEDYATLARRFAGVAKAAVAAIETDAAHTVAVTLAGSGNVEIDPHGDLVNNLATALHALSDPRQAFALLSCERVLLLVGASIDLMPDAAWEAVEPAIRSALTAMFGFDARAFGQAAFKSEAVAAIASVAGVADVALDRFTGISAATLSRLTALETVPVVDAAVAPLPARCSGGRIVPAQLVALDPTIRGTLLLRLRAGGAPL